MHCVGGGQRRPAAGRDEGRRGRAGGFAEARRVAGAARARPWPAFHARTASLPPQPVR